MSRRAGGGRTRVRSIDPTKPRRIRRTVIEPIALSGFGRWYLINVAPKIDRLGYRLTGGRLNSVPGAAIVFLTHKGAKSGKLRTTPLIYFTDGDDVIVMASNYGRGRHPAWFHNVKANPEIELRAAGRGGRYRASVTAGEERERLWALAKGFTRAYADYELRAGDRSIQVIRCTPLDEPLA